MTVRFLFAVPLIAALVTAPAALAANDTIKSLEEKSVDVRPGKIILDSSELARESYRDFLDLVSTDAELQAEALRRLGDLELEATEVEQLTENIEALDSRNFDNAVGLYQRLLEAYPNYRRNDTVLYQLARAYEVGGRNDDALTVLNELIERFPDTLLVDEVQFRRGEMLFLNKRYDDAEAAYQDVRAYGERSRFYEQSLYKLGWSQFKLGIHEDSLSPFFELLDRRIAGLRVGEGENRLEALSRAEREMIEDTFRVLSISFSYMDGADSIDGFLAQRGLPSYSHVIYSNLGDLYLEKERFQDAAETYEAFVEQDPFHPMSPSLQVQVIESYKQGGFPSLVLEGKKSFVERYGMDGEFWMRNPRAANESVAVHLKTNLTDLAQYYHAQAQKSGNKTDFQQAANWYRKYLAYFPGEADTANTNFLLAETLYESGEFDAAMMEYERTSYSYPFNDRSAEAGYAALLAYREHEATLEGVSKDTWHQQYLDSGLRFANIFPEHPESGAVLTTVAEDLFLQGQYDLAIAVGKKVVTKQPPAKPENARTAWTVIAYSHFDMGNFEDAESSYYSLRNLTPVDDVAAQADLKERIASSIYKQGEAARGQGANENAVRHFTRLGQVVPDSPIRETAEFDAAAVLINMQAWDRASVVLEQFRRDYPGSELADDVTQKLAVTYMGAGRTGQAASEFETIAVGALTTELVRREALWKASELYGEAGSLAEEKRVLGDLVARYPEPVSESIEARARMAEIARELGDQAERMAILETLIQVDATAGVQRSDRTRYLAATASLELAEPVRRRFEVVKLTQPLAESLKLKRDLMEEVIAAYTKASDFAIAEVTTASTYRLGEVYEQFSSDLLDSDRPTNLEADALEQYEILLEEQAYPFEEKSIDLYKANTDRAADGVYDEWVQNSFDRLAGLMPARYAKKERSEDVVTALY
ncbi:MAG: tetratricopeptide repeat protein [Gammaproteobacteria bacterium]|nr:tetratricopeptide repeat protein [Gammaproteobacteria bacterium]